MIDRDGFDLAPIAIPPSTRAPLIATLESVGNGGPARRRRGAVFAIRDLFGLVPEIRTLAVAPTVRACVEEVLGADAFAVRAILFDKRPEANWRVHWHQDVTIAVRRRLDAAGFGPWSTKAGIPHVRPPAWVMENMLAVRVHLDDCLHDNGALAVIPGSHRHGILDQQQIESLVARHEPVSCEALAGQMVRMRPLLLHASRPALQPVRRRIIHIEYASASLSDGLEWYERIPRA